MSAYSPAGTQIRNARLASYGPGDCDPPVDPESDFVNERTTALFDEESRDMYALASQLEWLWYSPKETSHDTDAVKALTLMVSGEDDAELGRLIRERTRKNLMWECEAMARKEWKENDA